jgi:hypothetical protein
MNIYINWSEKCSQRPLRNRIRRVSLVRVHLVWNVVRVGRKIDEEQHWSPRSGWKFVWVSLQWEGGSVVSDLHRKARFLAYPIVKKIMLTWNRLFNWVQDICWIRPAHQDEKRIYLHWRSLWVYNGNIAWVIPMALIRRHETFKINKPHWMSFTNSNSKCRTSWYQSPVVMRRLHLTIPVW